MRRYIALFKKIRSLLFASLLTLCIFANIFSIMEPAWRNKVKEVPSSVKALFKDAQLNNCWIYHQKTRKFYTPEEFLEGWKSLYRESPRYGSNEKEFLVMNPIAAIRQRAKWVDIANKELQEVLLKLGDSNPKWQHGK